MAHDNCPLQQVLADLTELVAAIDRRMPQADRAGEARIAQDAVQLRQRAQSRIAEIETLLCARR